MFEVGVLRKVEIEVDGEKLAHYFDELRGDAYLEFCRQVTDAGGGEISNAKFNVMSYDTRCQKVDGYADNGVDLMTAHPEDWRSFIPGGHKYLAMVELYTGANLKKKSSTSSPDSPTPSAPAQEK